MDFLFLVGTNELIYLLILCFGYFVHLRISVSHFCNFSFAICIYFFFQKSSSVYCFTTRVVKSNLKTRERPRDFSIQLFEVKQRRRIENKKGKRQREASETNFHRRQFSSVDRRVETNHDLDFRPTVENPLSRLRFHGKEQMKIKRRRIKSLQKSMDSKVESQVGQSLAGGRRY